MAVRLTVDNLKVALAQLPYDASDEIEMLAAHLSWLQRTLTLHGRGRQPAGVSWLHYQLLISVQTCGQLRYSGGSAVEGATTTAVATTVISVVWLQRRPVRWVGCVICYQQRAEEGELREWSLRLNASSV